MRFSFDPRKSKRLRENPRRGIGFEEVQELFSKPYWLDRRSDAPGQFLAVGWVGDRLYSVIFEVREDDERFSTLSHSGSLQNRKSNCMKNTRKSAKKPVSADAIARLAEQGKDVSHLFKGQGRMVQPIQRVNVDVTAGMLEELDRAAQDLNVSRQAVIKTLVRQALDQHYLARRARHPQSAS
jgi:uncharacterized DUF497 family protein